MGAGPVREEDFQVSSRELYFVESSSDLIRTWARKEREEGGTHGSEGDADSSCFCDCLWSLLVRPASLFLPWKAHQC